MMVAEVWSLDDLLTPTEGANVTNLSQDAQRLKTCTKCGKEKPESMFYRNGNSRRPDCKVCKDATRRAHFDRDPEQFIRMRARRRKYLRAYDRERYAEHREAKIACAIAWNAANKKKVKAKRLIAAAVRHGDMPSASDVACSVCGLTGRHYHHDDYDMPMSVRCMCSSCHRIWHRDNIALNGDDE